MSHDHRPTLATEYQIEPGRGLVIDGATFPWYVAADPTYRVQPVDEHIHILWVPVLVDGGIPEYGEPDGTTLTGEEAHGE